MIRNILLAVACFGLVQQLPAQIQITGLDGLAAKAKESVDITLDSNMLQMASRFLGSAKSKDKDQDRFNKLLAGLKNITVRSFEFAQEGQYKPEDVQPIRNQLRAPGWSKVVGVESKEDREITEIYTKMDGGQVAGVAIVAMEPKELTIVYIEGTIDLANLADLGGHLGIPALPVPGQKKGKE